MIAATVRYKLPPHIDRAACREHFHKIAPGFRGVKGLISKHFIWSESGWAGGGLPMGKARGREVVLLRTVA